MDLANIKLDLLDRPSFEKVQAKPVEHAPRILLLYGSTRERSFSRLAVLFAYVIKKEPQWNSFFIFKQNHLIN